MLVFLRHAERGDNEFPIQLSQVPYDPPITISSRQTIVRTGEELLQIFQSQKVQKVNIVCSKFLRCLMTAEGVADIIEKGGIEVCRPFKIEYQVGEYMRQDWFKEYPLENLVFDGIFHGKYIKEQQWENKKLDYKFPFPQNYVMFHKRVGQYKDELKFPNQPEVTLIVTHGFVVREMCWRMNHMPDIMAEVPYCGYAVFRSEGGRDVLMRAKL